MNFSGLIRQYCEAALKQAFPDTISEEAVAALEISSATQEQFGHYQLNSAMRLAKLWGQQPRAIAQKLVQALQESSDSSSTFQKIEIAGPGFINFTLHPKFLANTLTNQLTDPKLGVATLKNPRKVVIDFSSPNIAKEMHVGHLRSTIIGDCIARTLEFLGHDVLRLNHVGDWGTQFGMLIAHLKSVLPEIVEPTPPPVDLSDLVRWYKDAKKRFDEDPDFKKQAQLEVVALQGGEPTTTRAWEHICAISRKAYQEIYDILDIDLIERGESFYNPWLPSLVEALEQKGIVEISDGAKCIYLDGFTNRDGEKLPLILQKSDGGFNYATTDMAALQHRLNTEKGNWLIYVTDAGQGLHFSMVFEAGKKAEFYQPDDVRLDHVPFGLVLKPDGKKFKTRSGDTERLMDLLLVAISKAKERLVKHDPNLPEPELDASAQVLGINAIKYADLCSNRLSNYIFNYDKMLKFEGNTAAFLLYAYVRIQSIKRKVQADPLTLINQHTTLELNESSEIALALLVCQFSEILETFEKDLLPNRLTDYLHRLAEKFHEFFHQCRVEGSPQQNSRLLLCESVGQVIRQGMTLLGLKPLERM